MDGVNKKIEALAGLLALQPAPPATSVASHYGREAAIAGDAIGDRTLRGLAMAGLGAGMMAVPTVPTLAAGLGTAGAGVGTMAAAIPPIFERYHAQNAQNMWGNSGLSEGQPPRTREEQEALFRMQQQMGYGR